VRKTSVFSAAVLAMLISACGGGGGGGGAQTPTPPQPSTFGVLSTSIPDGTVAVALNAQVTVVFDTSIGSNTASTPVVVMSNGQHNVPITVQKTENTVVVKPDSPLALRTSYTLTIQGGLTADNGAKLAQDVTLHFRTVAAAFESRTLVPATTEFNGGMRPLVAAGDIDGDGRPDIVQLGRLLSQPYGQGYTLLVYEQDVAGNMVPVQQFDQELPGTSSVYIEHLVLLDIDGDGHPEILVSQRDPGYGPLTGLQIFKRDGAGRFQPNSFIATPYVLEVLVADLDRDGHPDLLGTGVDGFRAFMNHGSGLMEMPAVAAQVGVSQIAIGDLDRDGQLDVYVADVPYAPPGSGKRTVYSQSTPGVFAINPALTQATSDICAASVECLYPVLIDINGDGWLDLIHGRATDRPGLSVAHLRQPGAGFAPGFEASFGWGTNIFNVADMDGDGMSDLVIINNDTMGVGLGQRSATLEYAPAYQVPDDASGAGAVVVVDLDNDGRLDVVVASVGYGVIAMMGRGGGS
jgi:hypothetical protein